MTKKVLTRSERVKRARAKSLRKHCTDKEHGNMLLIKKYCKYCGRRISVDN